MRWELDVDEYRNESGVLAATGVDVRGGLERLVGIDKLRKEDEVHSQNTCKCSI